MAKKIPPLVPFTVAAGLLGTATPPASAGNTPMSKPTQHAPAAPQPQPAAPAAEPAPAPLHFDLYKEALAEIAKTTTGRDPDANNDVVNTVQAVNPLLDALQERIASGQTLDKIDVSTLQEYTGFKAELNKFNDLAPNDQASGLGGLFYIFASCYDINDRPALEKIIDMIPATCPEFANMQFAYGPNGNPTDTCDKVLQEGMETGNPKYTIKPNLSFDLYKEAVAEMQGNQLIGRDTKPEYDKIDTAIDTFMNAFNAQEDKETINFDSMPEFISLKNEIAKVNTFPPKVQQQVFGALFYQLATDDTFGINAQIWGKVIDTIPSICPQFTTMQFIYGDDGRAGTFRDVLVHGMLIPDDPSYGILSNNVRFYDPKMASNTPSQRSFTRRLAEAAKAVTFKS